MPIKFGSFGDDLIETGNERDLIFGLLGGDTINPGGGNDVVLLVAVHAFGAADIEDWIASRVEFDALKATGQKAAVPLPLGDRLRLPVTPDRSENDESGQVFAFAADPIIGPSAQTEPVQTDDCAADR